MDKLYMLYFSVPRPAFLGIINKAISKVMAIILKWWFDRFTVRKLRRQWEKGDSGLNTEKREENYVVSVTSFPARINDVWLTIETLFSQSFKADKIILWLSEDQFEGIELPHQLLAQQKRGLTICFVPGDIRSHKKYFYAFGQYADSNIITVDDDVYYPRHTLKYLYELHQKFPEAVTANRAHKMIMANGQVLPYRKWAHNYKKFKTPTCLLVPTGVGGVLYPPHCYDAEIFDEALFRKLCFMADDLWLKIQTLRAGTKVISSRQFTRDLITTGDTQKFKLVSGNSIEGGNDVQLKAILGHYNIDLAKICTE